MESREISKETWTSELDEVTCDGYASRTWVLDKSPVRDCAHDWDDERRDLDQERART